MIWEAGINFTSLADENFDSVMGESTGASVIFGTTGGVIEAVVRTAACWLDPDNPSPQIDFEQLRGIDGIREAQVDIAGNKISIAIAHGLGNARKLLTDIREGKVTYDAIEIMACPSGCVGGGGQPYHGNNIEVLKKRANAVYSEDKGKPVRRSHENQEIQKLYSEFLGEPYNEKAHELLHTLYQKREKIKKKKKRQDKPCRFFCASIRVQHIAKHHKYDQRAAQCRHGCKRDHGVSYDKGSVRPVRDKFARKHSQHNQE
jgi:iron only hydrogenase large subunit-like protein